MAVTGTYNVVYRPGAIISLAVSAAVVAGNLVEVTGNMTIGPAGAASRKAIGVALQSGSVSGDIIAVQLAGYVVRLINSGGVTAGDQVGAAAAGQVVTVAGGATADVARSIIGVALEGATTGLASRYVVGGQL
jgi:hypothetical protein